tara:strand:+ start:85 stop:204 length:120 start_codon:yes stop_codon:yes gene_type:complete
MGVGREEEWEKWEEQSDLSCFSFGPLDVEVEVGMERLEV